MPRALIQALLTLLTLAPAAALAQGGPFPTPSPRSPQPKEPAPQEPAPQEPAPQEPAERKDRQRVRPSRVHDVGSRPGSSALMIRLPPELVERALIDHELHTRRALAAGTLRLRRLLRGCELRMSWSLNQRFAGKRLTWKLGAAQGPDVTGVSEVEGGQGLRCDVRCVDREVKPQQQGYRYQARLRLTLGERTYDLLLELSVELSEPETKPGLRFQASWRGPFPAGKGSLGKAGFKRGGKGKAKQGPTPAGSPDK